MKGKIQDEIVDEFSMFDDWMGLAQDIIELGKKLPVKSKNLKLK
jgi:cysteine desulfuration protein SufE